ncbi:MAG: DUF3298 domain-containing protein [Oscillospiraceae bacterium]|nr:DUF3298 domain-containing protein [Oscillospiraceae bacterium]
MKKTIALLLALCALLCLSACGAEETPAATTVTEAPASAAATPEPEPLLTEPDPQIVQTLGAPVILNVMNQIETWYAPDDSGKLILSFGGDVVKVVLDDRGAAEKINQFLAMRDEMFYSGSGNGDGLNELLELATDIYTMSAEIGTSLNTECSSTRSAYIERGDGRVISIRYRVNTYTGGAHGNFGDTAYVFDTASGRLLTLDDLTDDRAALENALLTKMTELIETDVRYQPIQDYIFSFYPDQVLSEALKGLIREGSWLLGEEGIVVFSQPYEISSYADGSIRFTLRYDELDGILKEEWLPLERPEDGSLFISGIDGGASAAVSLLDKVSTAADGEEFRLFAQGTVYDVSIDSVVYISDHVGFYQTDTHWYCSYLSNAGVQVQTRIPEGMPDLMIRYLDAEGNVHSFLITQSGEDGSVILLEEEHIEPVG